ncbi:MAG: carboxypeptidase-like regulatory domain-containing protein [Bryobacteraceae bacterium]
MIPDRFRPVREAALAVLFLASAAPAQEIRGAILGRVGDPSGGAVAGAQIEVQSLATKVVTRGATNETGNYQVPFLLPGNYAVRVESPGFKRMERSGIRVSTNEQVTLDFTLEIGATSESVTVTTEAPILNTANADIGQVIDSNYVTMVSVSLSRNVLNVRNLAPGITGGTGTYTSSAQADFSVAGGGADRGGNEVIVDGIPSTSVGGTIGFVPSLDSVEEVKIHTTLFDAAYGHSNGGAISITTRSGTNDLHGAAYFYKRWRALNANSWNNNRLGLDKAAIDYHQYGYTVGGPVYIPKIYNGKNRTFFSTSLERDHDPRELTRQARVPTELERRGDFSQTVNRLGGAFALFDPNTTTGSGNSATRTPFPNAVIPSSRISPIGRALIEKYPLPTQSSITQIAAFNWASSKTYTVDQRQYSGRIDHVVSDKQRLFGRIGFLDRIQTAEDLFFGGTSYPVSGGSDLGSLFRRRISLGLDDTYVFSPTFVGSFRAGLLSYASESTNGAVGSDPSELQLPSIITANQAFPGWPTINLGDNLPNLGAAQSFSRDMITSGMATLTKLSGRHALKFGVDYRLGRINNASPGGNAAGSFTFSPVFTRSNPFVNATSDTSGSGMASLLLGAPASRSPVRLLAVNVIGSNSTHKGARR